MSRDDPSTPTAARSIVTPKFGRRLRALRGSRTRGEIMRQLQTTYHLPFSRSSLLQYERGTVAAPDPVVLWALARIYGTSFDGLMSALVRERLHVPISVSEATGPMDLSPAERQLLDTLRSLPKARQRMAYQVLLSLALD